MNKRIIEFRVWSFKEKRWLEDELIESKQLLNNILSSGNDDYTFSQHTGLFDKNKNPVFEGDIVTCGSMYHGKISSIYTGEIIYNEYCAAYQIKYKNLYNGYATDFLHNYVILEVVGNIFEYKVYFKKTKNQ